MTMMDTDPRYVWFLDDSAFRETDRPGFRRRVVNGAHLQLCFWRIAGGSTGSVLHAWERQCRPQLVSDWAEACWSWEVIMPL